MVAIMKRIRHNSMIFIAIQFLILLGSYLTFYLLKIDLVELLASDGDFLYFFIIIAIFIIIEMIYLFLSYRKIEKKILVNYMNISSTLGADIKESYHFAGIGMFAYDELHEIIWTNELLEERGMNVIGENFETLFPELSKLILDDKKNATIEMMSRKYQVKLLPELKLFILKDITDFSKVESILHDLSPVIMQIIIDNYQDISNLSDETALSDRTLKVRELIIAFAEKYSVLLKKHRNDGFLGVLTEKSYLKMLNDNFTLLDEVRIIGDRENPFTLSIGIARGTDDIVKLGDLSNNAIDVSFSRGGDQVVVNTFGQNLEFFGGKTEAKSSQNKVRIRVQAQSLTVHIQSAKNVIIMGHINADFDALGASLGIYAMCAHYKVPARIVYEEKLYELETRQAFKNIFGRETLAAMTATSTQALNSMNKNTLLIIVDVHKPSMVLAPKLLEAADKIAVIDHHRRGEEFIESPIFSMIEPSSSSTCEMVAEYIKYSTGEIEVSPEIATMMLTGILLDTNNYRRQTGARTFDASMILKDYDADTDKANDFLKDGYEEYSLINKIKANTTTPFWGILVSAANEEDIVARATLAKIATDGLNVKDINAIFVIGRISPDEVAISGRSNSRINVQLILEKMGGGGHFTAAAAQFKDKTIDFVKTEFLKILEQYLEQAKAK